MVASEITTGISGLHNHLLSGKGSRGKGQLITCAAPRALASSSNVNGGVSIGEVLTDSPWGLVGTHVGASAITARCRVEVCERAVIDVASGDWSGAAGKSDLS